MAREQVEERARVWCATREASFRRKDGERAVEVTIIRPGVSSNGLRYTDAVLRESVPLWEGAACFCDHPTALDETRAGGRSVRDLAGVYSDARYEDGVRATLRFYPGAEAVYKLVEAAVRDREEGRAAPPIGISADMHVVKERAGNVWEVRKISKVTSGDIVFQPAAGGRFERILEAEEVKAMEDAGKQGNEGTTVQQELCRTLLEVKLAASGMPEAAQGQVRQRFEGRAFEAAELDTAIGGMKSLIGEVTRGQVVKGMGQPRFSVGKTPLERVQMGLDRLFGLEVSDPSVPRLSGIREAYLLITGDRQFRGRYNWEESVVREADEVTTSVLADALLNSMTKRLVKDYEAQPKWWYPIVRRVAISDMKQQNRILLNDFASLSSVSENAAYTNLAWGDTRENYTPAKRGNLVVVTLEAILNDDTQAVTRVPGKLASAAVVTLNEFVSTFFTDNSGAGPTMADTHNVFDAANHQGNSGTTALASAAVQAAIVAMLKYTNSASKRLGIRPRCLLVPPDLAFTAQLITESTQTPGTANNDVNVLRGALETVIVPQWTDANNWYLMADPNLIEGIELGFLSGQETPDLLVQDNPTDGSVFTNDAISYKVRHIFGGGWLDYRAGYASIVA